MKIIIVDGEIIEKQPNDTIYLALCQRDGFWSVAGVFYLSPEQAEISLAGMNYDRIILVRCRLLDNIKSET